METILVLATPKPTARSPNPPAEALHAARTLNKSFAGSSLVVGLVGESVQAAADSIAACPATKYFGVAGKDFAQSRYASDAAAAEAICKSAQATLIVAPATSRWARVLPRCRTAPRWTRRHPRDRRIRLRAAKPAINRWYYRHAWKPRSPARNGPGSFSLTPAARPPAMRRRHGQG